MNNLHGKNKTTNLVATVLGNNADYPMFGVQQTSEGYTTSTDRPTGDVLQRSQGNFCASYFYPNVCTPTIAT